jgi:hypothetical protein
MLGSRPLMGTSSSGIRRFGWLCDRGSGSLLYQPAGRRTIHGLASYGARANLCGLAWQHAAQDRAHQTSLRATDARFRTILRSWCKKPWPRTVASRPVSGISGNSRCGETQLNQPAQMSVTDKGSDQFSRAAELIRAMCPAGPFRTHQPRQCAPLVPLFTSSNLEGRSIFFIIY